MKLYWFHLAFVAHYVGQLRDSKLLTILLQFYSPKICRRMPQYPSMIRLKNGLQNLLRRIYDQKMVPIDGSETARNALKYAVDLARQTGSSIILLSVIDRSPYFGAPTVPSVSTPTHLLENLEDYLRQTAEAYVAEAEELCRTEGVASRKIIGAGHPVEEIKGSRGLKVDLIVMGSHGKSALGAALLGSVTIGLIHSETKFPVLVVRR